jgi:hypothetical protein
VSSSHIDSEYFDDRVHISSVFLESGIYEMEFKTLKIAIKDQVFAVSAV